MTRKGNINTIKYKESQNFFCKKTNNFCNLRLFKPNKLILNRLYQEFHTNYNDLMFFYHPFLAPSTKPRYFSISHLNITVNCKFYPRNSQNIMNVVVEEYYN